MDIGPFAGPIYTAMLLVDCLFFLFLEWWMPREDLHFVRHHWNPDVFAEVCLCCCANCMYYFFVLFWLFLTSLWKMRNGPQRSLLRQNWCQRKLRDGVYLPGMYHAYELQTEWNLIFVLWRWSRSILLIAFSSRSHFQFSGPSLPLVPGPVSTLKYRSVARSCYHLWGKREQNVEFSLKTRHHLNHLFWGTLVHILMNIHNFL